MVALQAKVDSRPLLPLSRAMAGAGVVRLPTWVTSNQVSAVGIACTIICGVAFSLASLNRAWLLVAIVGLRLNWVADNVDGALARTRGMTSEQGRRPGAEIERIGIGR